MLVVVPVYGTDRQSQRKLGPREGGDCTRSLLPAPSTRTGSAPSRALSFRGPWGDLRWGSGSRGAERSPDPWLHTATAAPLQSPWLVTRGPLILGQAFSHSQKLLCSPPGSHPPPGQGCDRLHWQVGAAPTPPPSGARWSRCPGSSGGGLHLWFRPQHRRDPSQGQAPAPPKGGPPACRAPTPPGSQAWGSRDMGLRGHEVPEGCQGQASWGRFQACHGHPKYRPGFGLQALPAVEGPQAQPGEGGVVPPRLALPW